MALALAACLIELPSDGDNLHLLPAGPFRAVDGRPTDAPHWVLPPERAAALSTRIAARKTARVIDYEHQTLHAERNGQPAPAAGWFRRVEWRADGLHALGVEWTARAQAAIAAHEYRYLSPVFTYHPGSGEIVDLLHAALTNTPALDDLSAVAARLHLEALSMNDDLLERLRYMLNLPTLATAEDIAASLQKLIDMLNAAQPAATAETRLSLPAWIAALQTAAPDPAQYVPVAALTAVQTELTAAQTALAALNAAHAQADLDALIQAGLKDGRLLPPLESWARELGAKDLAALKAYLAQAQPLAALTGMQTAGQTPPPAAPAPSPELAAVAAQFGHSLDALKTYGGLSA